MFLLLYVTGLVESFSLLSIFILSFLLPDAPHDRSPFPRFQQLLSSLIRYLFLNHI